MVAQTCTQLAVNKNIQLTETLVCIDGKLPDIPILLQGIKPNHTCLILHPQEDGITQITEYLASHRISTLHLVCHGAPGYLALGNSSLNRLNLTDYAHQLQQWQVPNLVIWACEVGQDLEFLTQLEKLTQSHIAASSQKLGKGNWKLDQKLGESSPQIPFNRITQKSYTGILVVMVTEILANFSPATNFNTGNFARFVAIEDFNSDNALDLAVANRNNQNVSILLGNGSGNFSTATNFNTGTGPRLVAIGDFNGDYLPDLAVPNFDSDNVSILLGNGSGGFSSATNFGTVDGASSLAIGDFNSDNLSDLAVPSFYSDNVSILLGNGSGSFNTITNFSAGDGPVYLAIGDFNGDNQPDLAVANRNSNNVSILLGNGSSNFSTATNFSVGLAPNSVAIGDFNGDSQLDLAVVNIDSNNVSILLGNGNGSFSTATNFSVGGSPLFVAIGDFNKDNFADLAVAISASNSVSILLGNGSGSFSTAGNFGVGNVPESVAIGDFNGDNKPDLAVSNRYSNNVSILLNTTPTVRVDAPGTPPQEQGNTPGTFTFSLDNPITHPLTLTWEITGTANTPDDYSFTDPTTDPNVTAFTGTSITLAPGATSTTLTVIPLDDNIAEGNETLNLTLLPNPNYILGTNTNASLSILENDTAGITLDPTIPLTTTEAGATAQGTLRLNSQPIADVIVTLNSNDPTEGIVTPSSLTFTPTNWNIPQPLTIIGQDDLIADGDIAYQIIGISDSFDSNYDDSVPGNQVIMNVTNIDNDGAGVILTQMEGFTEVTEGNTTPDTYTIALNSNPLAAVGITVMADEQLEISLDGINFTQSLTLNFSDTTPQTISVLAVNDTLPEALHSGEITHLVITDSDPNYNSSLTIMPLTVSILDNDLSPSPTPTPETPGGTTPETPINTIPEIINNPPFANPDSITTLINTPVSIPVLANDVDFDLDDLIWINAFDVTSKNGGTITLEPQNTLDPADDLLIYTPSEDFLGTDSFNYTITDEEATSTATVTVEVEFLRENLPQLEFIVETRFPPLPNATVNRFQVLDNGQILRITGDSDEIIGTARNNLLFGLFGNDNIFGLAGEDRLYGNEGTDFLVGGLGEDHLLGGLDDDALFGDQDHDLLLGGPGNDFILGGQDQDLLEGDSGDDYLEGNRGNDTLYGEDGNDIAFGNTEDDVMLGNQGNDSLVGNEGNDSLLGGMGADLLIGELGNDTLVGGEDNDTLVGGEGNDSLVGGLGNNLLVGDVGSDTFFLAGDQGIDTLYDFNPDEDRLNFGNELGLANIDVMKMTDGVVLKRAESNDIFAHILGVTVNEISIL